MITIPEKFKRYSIEGKKYETNDYKNYTVTLSASRDYLEEDDDWFQYEVKWYSTKNRHLRKRM